MDRKVRSFSKYKHLLAGTVEGAQQRAVTKA